MRTVLASITLFITLGAHAAPATLESVENLLVATKVESTIDTMYTSLEQMMRQGMAQSTQGKPLSAEQQRIIDGMPAKFVAVMREELNWPKMKPLYIQLYRDTFDQEEVEGLLVFYASPAGKAFVDKMPLVMQKSMTLTQTLMQTLGPKMAAAMKEAMAEAKLQN